jgi:hypothetical protein
MRAATCELYCWGTLPPSTLAQPPASRCTAPVHMQLSSGVATAVAEAAIDPFQQQQEASAAGSSSSSSSSATARSATAAFLAVACGDDYEVLLSCAGGVVDSRAASAAGSGGSRAAPGGRAVVVTPGWRPPGDRLVAVATAGCWAKGGWPGRLCWLCWLCWLCCSLCLYHAQCTEHRDELCMVHACWCLHHLATRAGALAMHPPAEPDVLGAAGGGHVVAVTSGGQLWGWGSNSCGQLGLGALQWASCPAQLLLTQPPQQAPAAASQEDQGHAADCAAGLAASHEQLSDGSSSGPANAAWPAMGQPPNAASTRAASPGALQVACGSCHTVVLAAGGAVYVAGSNEWGACCQGPRTEQVGCWGALPAWPECLLMACGCLGRPAAGLRGLLLVVAAYLDMVLLHLLPAAACFTCAVAQAPVHASPPPLTHPAGHSGRHSGRHSPTLLATLAATYPPCWPFCTAAGGAIYRGATAGWRSRRPGGSGRPQHCRGHCRRPGAGGR